jgi:hypothetical protein
VVGELLGAWGTVNHIGLHAMTGFMGRTVVEVAMEIMIAIMAISFVTVLLPPTTVIPVVITLAIAASDVIVVIVAVVELEIIVVGRVPAIVVITSVSPWIDAMSHMIIVAYMVVWADRCA